MVKLFAKTNEKLAGRAGKMGRGKTEKYIETKSKKYRNIQPYAWLTLLPYYVTATSLKRTTYLVMTS
jgi:hypothetical protein